MVIETRETPADSGSFMSDGEILDYIYSKEWDYGEAIKILDCESGGVKRAHNAELVAKAKGLTEYSSCGLFQINSPLCPDDPEEESVLYDPKTNIDAAWELYKERGWQPWLICSKKMKGR